ncbi:MAG: FHA domain-containing protein [Anaerolineales bacterium]|nr:MAG: FHA domain-containing protein [Anaerolineales bacterium]
MQVVERWIGAQGWLLPFAGGILIWAVGAAALLAVAILLFLITRHRQRVPSAPPPTSAIPFLKSSDDRLYFRLDGLDGNGLVIGRGKQGIDLRIPESVPHADTVSNQHARIYYDATYGLVIIEDLDSTNGIFINNRQAPRKNLLRNEWVVGLGQVTLVYHDGETDTGPLD